MCPVFLLPMYPVCTHPNLPPRGEGTFGTGSSNLPACLAEQKNTAMPIRLLSPDVSSKIAAGEVTERPASVVKELVENSLDGGATEIHIEIRAGGVEYIRVVDNGCGIGPDEVELAFRRFATSKVASAADLEEISTLGFRGEALPSIAAVASVTLVTRSAAEEFGTRIDVANSEVAGLTRHGAPPGTSVVARNLFRDFPARRKFLRSTATETSRVQTMAAKYALAYPEVSFELQIDGSTSLSTSGSGELRDAVAKVYGLPIAQAMLEVESDEGSEGEGLAVTGLVSPPSVHRATRGYASLFVNRRWVQNRALGFALEQAYHGLLMERRYPVAVLNISVNVDDLDVNVHPAKTEVRFRSERQVFGAVQQAVRSALTAHSPVPQVGHATISSASSASGSPVPAFWPANPFARPQPAPDRRQFEPDEALIPEGQPPSPREALPALRVLGQVQSTYIAAEGPDGMYLIDQHAAHERVVFERVMADVESKTVSVQSLLAPETVDLNAAQEELLSAHHELVLRVGFQVEPFGGLTYLVRGVPSLVDTSPGQALLEILDSMLEGGGFESWEERAAYSIACHGAIRAGKTLSQEEMTALTRQLERCQQPNTCPHGRPTMVHLTTASLEREFGRR